MIKKILYISFFIFTLLFSSDKVYAGYKQDIDISNQTPVYDITSLSIKNDILTVSGWAYVNNKDNGKFVGANDTVKVLYSPEYRIYIKDKNGNTAAEGKFTRWNKPPIAEDRFSLTCIKFNNVGGMTASDCMKFGHSYNARNNKFELDVNQWDSSNLNKYYDAVDFQIIIDNLSSKLQANVDYHLELEMELSDGTTRFISKRIPIFVYQDRVKVNPDETNFETHDATTSVKIISSLAKIQNGNIKYNNASPIQNGCYFMFGSQLDYEKIEIEDDISTNYAKYYYYQLHMKAGAFSGTCTKITSDNIYKNNPHNYTVWAHAAWVQPYANSTFGLIIQKKDPCVYGTETETATEYAISHPNTCCEQIPETCCGNKAFINQKYNSDPNNYIFASGYCCNSTGTYNMDSYEPYRGKTFYSFYSYLDVYSRSEINKICKRSEWAGRACPTGTTKEEGSTVLSMQYIYGDRTGQTITHEVEMLSESDDVSKDDIGFAYFLAADFNDYLRKATNTYFKNESYKNYVLNNTHFKITINSVTKIGNTQTNGKYKYKVTFSIEITSMEGAVSSPEGYYFIPVKLWYCEEPDEIIIEEDNCDNSTYFNEHKHECCLEDDTREGCSCEVTPGEVCYSYDTTSDCNKTSDALYNNGVKRKTLTNGTETIKEEIYFDEYTNLYSMQLYPISAGTGFEYNIDEVTHKITMERHYDSAYSGSTTIWCYSSGCTNSVRQRVKNLYDGVKRNTTNDINHIKDFKFKFDGESSSEIYNIDNVTRTQRTLKSDTIEICELVCTTNSEGDEECSTSCSSRTYPSKIEYTYKYKLTLKNKYISKLHNSSDEDENILSEAPPSSESKNYLDGGNKFYTPLDAEKGIYDINISLTGAYKRGLTGYLDDSEKFTCQYEINNDGPGTDPDESNYYFRQISLSSPFPNSRVIGNNWNDYCTDGENCKYITTNEDNSEKKDKVYQETPLYEITLDSELINQIKSYHRSNNLDYGWNNMTTYSNENSSSTSNFINGTGSTHIIWGDKLKLKTSFDRKTKIGDF